jgi:hypothetical protein
MARRRKPARVVAAATAAAAVLVQAAGAADGPPAGRHDALDVRVVSSPANLVSGNDARIEIGVPTAIAYADVEVRVRATRSRTGSS